MSGWKQAIEDEYALYQAPLADDLTPWRHDAVKLAEVVMDLYYERTGPLANGSRPGVEPKNGTNT